MRRVTPVLATAPLLSSCSQDWTTREGDGGLGGDSEADSLDGGEAHEGGLTWDGGLGLGWSRSDAGSVGSDAGAAMDSAVGSVSGSDASADSCVRNDEICNGLDDDCDGVPDGPVASQACPSASCVDGKCTPLATVHTLRAGWAHTCAVTGRGLACTGGNQYGQLGQNDTTDRPSFTLIPGVRDVIDVAAYSESTCAATASGELWCWGRNDQGAVGDGSTVQVNKPKKVSDLLHVTQVSIGGNFTCALSVPGNVSCWGAGARGQLGTGATSDSSSPVSVPLTTTKYISASSGHACAILNEGTVKCWGWNVEGQLGNDSKVDSLTPVSVFGLGGAIQVAAGGRHTCALIGASGTISCWGMNTFGQLGNKTTTSSLTPVVVSGLPSKAAQITAGGGHTCALLTNKTVWCWGLNDQGQVSADGMTSNAVSTPQQVPALTKTPIEVMAGDRHTCIRFMDQTVSCWGQNNLGQAGTGSTNAQLTPVPVNLPSAP